MIVFNKMPIPQVLNALGLISNTIATVVLIIPYLKPVRNLNDDLLLDDLGNQKTGEYTQRKHLKERRTNRIGLFFLATGFIFQLIAIFC